MEESKVATAGPVVVDITYPERLSRRLAVLKVLLGWLYIGIPHGIALWLYGIAVGVVTSIAVSIILFTGKYPKGMFDFVVSFYRWQMRVTAYTSFLRDEYPPFHGHP